LSGLVCGFKRNCPSAVVYFAGRNFKRIRIFLTFFSCHFAYGGTNLVASLYGLDEDVILRDSQ